MHPNVRVHGNPIEDIIKYEQQISVLPEVVSGDTHRWGADGRGCGGGARRVGELSSVGELFEVACCTLLRREHAAN